MRATGHGLPWPKAVLDVHALGMTGTPEFAFRVDDGIWSTFLAAPNGELVVEHPAFLFQGLHTIEVRSRMEAMPHGISNPAEVGFLVDWEPPEVSLTADREHDLVLLAAHDVVTPDGQLQYAYAVGDGAMSEFGPARAISLSAVEPQGGVTVQVKDEAGNVATVSWKSPVTALRPDATAPAESTPARGCSTAPGAFSLLLLLSALWPFRRRR